jgi:hypothetical protein
MDRWDDEARRLARQVLAVADYDLARGIFDAECQEDPEAAEETARLMVELLAAALLAAAHSERMRADQAEQAAGIAIQAEARACAEVDQLRAEIEAAREVVEAAREHYDSGEHASECVYWKAPACTCGRAELQDALVSYDARASGEGT